MIVSTPTVGSPLMRRLSAASDETIYRMQSGSPLTVTTTGDAGLLSSAQRPDRIGSGKIDNPTIAKWFDTSAFIQNSPGSYGNSGRNILTGPHNTQIDIVSRRFEWESQRIEFRAEAFNAFNVFRPNNPNTALTNTIFRRVPSPAQDARIMQFAFKYVF